MNTVDDMDFRELIKNRRAELNLTLEDVAKAVGVGKATVQRWESGEIKNLRRDRIAKLAKVLNLPPSALVTADDSYEDYERTEFDNVCPIDRFHIPILGDIACGEPRFADSDFEGYTEVGAGIRADFALHCKGDSMIGARIYDGDLVFIRRQDDVADGEIAAVIIDDEATLKRVYKLPGGRVQLRAENPRYAPIYIGGDDESRYVHILGKAVAFQGNVI